MIFREYVFIRLWRVREWYGKFTAAFEIELLPQDKLTATCIPGSPQSNRTSLQSVHFTLWGGGAVECHLFPVITCV